MLSVKQYKFDSYNYSAQSKDREVGDVSSFNPAKKNGYVTAGSDDIDLMKEHNLGGKDEEKIRFELLMDLYQKKSISLSILSSGLEQLKVEDLCKFNFFMGEYYLKALNGDKDAENNLAELNYDPTHALTFLSNGLEQLKVEDRCKFNFFMGEYCLKALNGDKDAKKNLAELNYDPTHALTFFKLAADYDHPEALIKLGTMYKDGIGVNVDLKQAELHFQEAVKRENHNATEVLGKFYLELVKKSESNYNSITNSIKYLKKAEDCKCDEARYELGLAYLAQGKLFKNGKDDIGINKNLEKAESFFLEAEKRGNHDATNELKKLYLELAQKSGDCSDTKRSIKELTTAIAYLMKAQNRGCKDARTRLGLAYLTLGNIYKNGLNNVVADLKQAESFFIISKNCGNIHAIEQLREIYLQLGKISESHKTTKENINVAITYLKKAKEYGCEAAKTELGLAYLARGHLYTNNNNADLSIWDFQEAVKYGCFEAYFALGELYQKGYTSPNCKKLAYKNFLLAAENGIAKANLSIGKIRMETYLSSLLPYAKYNQQSLNLIYNHFSIAANKGVAGAYLELEKLASLDSESEFRKELFNFIKEAADKHDAEANLVLGRFYKAGVGVEKNVKLASDSLEIAKKSKDGQAEFEQGMMYLADLGEVQKDIPKAIELFTRADIKGYMKATYELGKYYLISGNEFQAKSYFLKAHYNGIEIDEEYKKLLDLTGQGT